MAHVSDLIAQRHRGLPRRARAQEPAALHHLRQRRRRQVDADRPAAVRLQDDLRGPARRARGRLEEGRHAGRRARLRAAGRRPRGRARAGHHHRRRLPLLLDRQAQVHRRRHARPRAVHAQHGDRRLDRRPRRDPDRRAQGRADADPAAQLHRLAARHPPRRAGGQQDGPGRLLAARRFDAIVADYREFAQQIGLDGRRRRSRCRRCNGDNIIERSADDALVPRPDADGSSRDGRGRGRRAAARRSACRCSGSTARTSISAASPARSSSGTVQPGRHGARAAVGPREHASRASSPSTATWSAPSPARRSRSRSPTRSTSAAATCSPRPTALPGGRRPVRGRRSSGCATSRCCPGRPYLLKIGTQAR